MLLWMVNNFNDTSIGRCRADRRDVEIIEVVYCLSRSFEDGSIKWKYLHGLDLLHSCGGWSGHIVGQERVVCWSRERMRADSATYQHTTVMTGQGWAQ
eukprot:4433295-Amphidinium_carterae.1